MLKRLAISIQENLVVHYVDTAGLERLRAKNLFKIGSFGSAFAQNLTCRHQLMSATDVERQDLAQMILASLVDLG